MLGFFLKDGFEVKLTFLRCKKSRSFRYSNADDSCDDS